MRPGRSSPTCAPGVRPLGAVRGRRRGSRGLGLPLRPARHTGHRCRRIVGSDERLAAPQSSIHAGARSPRSGTIICGAGPAGTAAALEGAAAAARRLGAAGRQGGLPAGQGLRRRGWARTPSTSWAPWGRPRAGRLSAHPRAAAALSPGGWRWPASRPAPTGWSNARGQSLDARLVEAATCAGAEPPSQRAPAGAARRAGAGRRRAGCPGRSSPPTGPTRPCAGCWAPPPTRTGPWPSPSAATRRPRPASRAADRLGGRGLAGLRLVVPDRHRGGQRRLRAAAQPLPRRPGRAARRLRDLLPEAEPDPDSLRAHHLPFSSFRPPPGRGLVRSAGDAASLVNPLSGGRHLLRPGLGPPGRGPP